MRFGELDCSLFLYFSHHLIAADRPYLNHHQKMRVLRGCAKKDSASFSVNCDRNTWTNTLSWSDTGSFPFYDALTKPRAIKDFYENDALIAVTKELSENLHRNRAIDWQKHQSLLKVVFTHYNFKTGFLTSNSLLLRNSGLLSINSYVLLYGTWALLAGLSWP